MKLTKLGAAALVLAGAAFTTGISAAQTQEPADTLKVNYFSNANTGGAPDGTVRITNPGTAAPTDPGSAGTNRCAYIAVFDSNQEMSECCGCFVSADGLRTLSVDSDLTANPFNGQKLATGVIKIVSAASAGTSCPLPTSATGSGPLLEPAVRAWGTHIQSSNFALTETEFQDATLSTTEIRNLQSECYAIELVGSETGICSCGSGGGGGGT
jgi:hypothetical protein